LLGAYEVDGEKLLKLRNPWAVERYTGPRADTDEFWLGVSSAEKARIGYVEDTDDGIFFMPIDDFVDSFSSI